VCLGGIGQGAAGYRDRSEWGKSVPAGLPSVDVWGIDGVGVRRGEASQRDGNAVGQRSSGANGFETGSSGAGRG
jgi:hypothetical protein